MSDKKTIVIDMDEVITDLMPEVIRYYNALYSSDITLEDITKWDLPKDMRDLFSVPDLFLDLNPVKGALLGMKKLNRLNCNIIIASDCGGDKNIEIQKMYWLERYLPFKDMVNVTEISFGGDKGLLTGDVIIDDGLHNLYSFKKTNPNSTLICMDKPWNREFKGLRVFNWDNITELITLIV